MKNELFLFSPFFCTQNAFKYLMRKNECFLNVHFGGLVHRYHINTLPLLLKEWKNQENKPFEK